MLRVVINSVRRISSFSVIEMQERLQENSYKKIIKIDNIPELSGMEIQEYLQEHSFEDKPQMGMININKEIESKDDSNYY